MLTEDSYLDEENFSPSMVGADLEGKLSKHDSVFQIQEGVSRYEWDADINGPAAGNSTEKS